MSRPVPAQTLIRNARVACERVAVGPFTPVVFERFEYLGGVRGVRLGFPNRNGGVAWI